jgi:hypothetical protein
MYSQVDALEGKFLSQHFSTSLKVLEADSTPSALAMASEKEKLWSLQAEGVDNI